VEHDVGSGIAEAGGKVQDGDAGAWAMNVAYPGGKIDFV
jgi:hypothetical protein